MCMQNRQQIMGQKNQFLTESQVLYRLRVSSVYYCRYQALNDEWKKRFMDFCTGKKTLPLTYDPFFKRIFHKLLIKDYPWLAEIYEEMESYIQKPEEVLTMFSDALKILDQNTVQYMIEEQAQKREQQLKQIDAQNQQLDEQSRQLNVQTQLLNEQAKQLKEMSQQISESAIQSCISTCQTLKLTKEQTQAIIIDKFNLTLECAKDKMECYW